LDDFCNYLICSAVADVVSPELHILESITILCKPMGGCRQKRNTDSVGDGTNVALSQSPLTAARTIQAGLLVERSPRGCA
jgi:hypothetical protein